MKIKKLFVCYLGIILGTIIANFYLYDLGFLSQCFQFYQTTNFIEVLIKRSIEIVLLVYIGMVVGEKIWFYVIDFLSGTALGILVAAKTMTNGLFHTILFFLIALIIVVLYNVVIKMIMTESTEQGGILHLKLHNSLVCKIVIITIILINSFIELKILKLF